MRHYVLDANNASNVPLNVPLNVKALKIININDDNFRYHLIPDFITSLELVGQLSIFTVPENITTLICDNIGLNEIILNNNLQRLYCFHNNLTNIVLPDNIIYVDVSNNKITSISAKDVLTKIIYLDIRDNFIQDFDIKLPLTMWCFLCKNNPGIKIKYLNFMFAQSDMFLMIAHDLTDMFLNNEFLRNRLFKLCNAGCTYVDIYKLDDNTYYNNTLALYLT